MYSPNYLPNLWLTNPLDGPIIKWDEMNYLNKTYTSETNALNVVDFSSTNDFTETKGLGTAIFHGMTAAFCYSGFKDTASFIDDSSPSSINGNHYENVIENKDVSDLNDSGFEESPSFVDDSSPATIHSSLRELMVTSDLNDSGFEESPSFNNVSSPVVILLEESVKNILEKAVAEEKIQKIHLKKERKKYVSVKKSSLSYVQMVFLAMYNSPEGVVTLKKLYQYLSDNFTSLRGKINWYNTVRHNLSNRTFFEKVKDIPVPAYRVLNIFIFDELKKSVQQLMKNRGFESLGMETKAPIERICAENRSFMMNKVAVQKPIINITEVPPLSEGISADLFFALREHSFDIEVDEEK